MGALLVEAAPRQASKKSGQGSTLISFLRWSGSSWAAAAPPCASRGTAPLVCKGCASSTGPLSFLPTFETPRVSNTSL
jgi:hypothetical protein